ncbi:ClpXP protease specificity-enhancing factor [Nitrosomonas communis]|uniref:ClpXP protease specificity-enhancing factor n=1 Tax=Nitrosomonas communis TaxID=44574 RepID=UPI0026EA35A5|nr:ClpXP protease specificity-enhancing factor [Nitrosomonas communis]MCO6427551.1 ClpXP protease specificity-enhancing factor [Nitrosomonas communis]
MKVATTKPYLIRAIYEWCIDNSLTAYISVEVNQNTSVPHAYVKDGKITLDISPVAARDLLISNDSIQFTARFSGASRKIFVPISAIKAIFAKEINHSLFFTLETVQRTSYVFESDDANRLGPLSDDYLSHKDECERTHLKIVK